MKVTRKKLMERLGPSMQMIADMQARGAVFLSDTANNALTKNYMKLHTLQKYFDQETERLKLLHVQRHPNGFFKTEMRGEEKHYVYKSSADETKFIEALEAWGDVEEDWLPFKVSSDDLAKIHNFPIQAYAVLNEFECITDLKLATGAMVAVPGRA